MNWIILSIVFAQLFSFINLQAADNQYDDSDSCFIFFDPAEGRLVYMHNPAFCEKQASPCSTFKIPLALMGFDSEILIDCESPLWRYEVGDDECPWVLPLEGPISPISWMRQSCIWYSQVLARKLGMPLLENYLDLFDYGNQDMSGNPGKNDGLSQAWLCSSLEISPSQQVSFLNRLVSGQLDISLSTVERTKQLLFMGELSNGWKLYGKTGTGYCRNDKGIYETNIKQGWFIGWIERNGEYLTFAGRRIFPNQIPAVPSGWMVRDGIIMWLKQWAEAQTLHGRQSTPMSMHVEN